MFKLLIEKVKKLYSPKVKLGKAYFASVAEIKESNVIVIDAPFTYSLLRSGKANSPMQKEKILFHAGDKKSVSYNPLKTE